MPTVACTDDCVGTFGATREEVDVRMKRWSGLGKTDRQMRIAFYKFFFNLLQSTLQRVIQTKTATFVMAFMDIG